MQIKQKKKKEEIEMAPIPSSRDEIDKSKGYYYLIPSLFPVLVKGRDER